jgi:hypothetical protein
VKDKREPQAPRARKDGLLVQELHGEVLVYDLERDKAHCLNPTAALIWQHCDGQTTIRELTRLLENSLATPIDEDVIWCALHQLEKDRLLQAPLAIPPGMHRISRRALVRRIGVAAILLPLITTITAPTALANVSCTGSCVPGGPSNGGCPAGCTCSSVTSTCVNI